jgi:cytochrome c oxidase subunit 2
MPIAVEVVPPAEFAAWVASKGGHMPGATPAAQPAPAAAQTGGGVSAPAPAVAGTENANAAAPAATNPNVANRTTH